MNSGDSTNDAGPVRMVGEYRVKLGEYSGPMDLLLYLVRRNELDVRRLPIASITTQFQQFLGVLEFIDLDSVGEFVVVAGTLIELKSREVLPQTDDSVEEEIAADTSTPSHSIIDQILSYKRYKDAANQLDARAARWQERYPRLSDDRPRVGKNPAEDSIRDVELWDLVNALSRVLQKKLVEQTSSIRYDDTPISTYVEQIGERVRSELRVPFSAFFNGENLRSRIIGIFLAVLELLRHHSYRAEQPVEYGEIYIMPPIEANVALTTRESESPAAPPGPP